MQNFAMAILYIFRVKESIFYAPIPVSWIEKPNLVANIKVIILTLLPKSTKALTSLY